MTNESPFAPRTAGGTFFKPKDHVDDLAIIFEFKKVLKDQPHTYEGIDSRRDLAFGDISCFRNSEDVANAKPSLVIQNATVSNQVLVADVERNDWLGKATVQQIRKVGKPYVYRDGDITPEAMAAATKFYTEREAAVASVEVPDFGAAA